MAPNINKMAPNTNKLAPIQIVAPKINKMAPKINKYKYTLTNTQTSFPKGLPLIKFAFSRIFHFFDYYQKGNENQQSNSISQEIVETSWEQSNSCLPEKPQQFHLEAFEDALAWPPNRCRKQIPSCLPKYANVTNKDSL